MNQKQFARKDPRDFSQADICQESVIAARALTLLPTPNNISGNRMIQRPIIGILSFAALLAS